MTARNQLRVIVAALLIIGFGVAAFKHFQLGFPVWPGERETVWTAEAKVSFEADGEPVRVRLSLPNSTNNLLVLDQGTAGFGFGYYVENNGFGRTGVWEARDPEGEHSVYHRARIYRGGSRPDVFADFKAPEKPEPPVFNEGESDAADAVLAEAHAFSANAKGLAIQLSQAIWSKEPSQSVNVLLGDEPSSRRKNSMITRLLHSASVPTMTVRGMFLDEAERSSRLSELLAVWNEEAWVVINPQTGEAGLPDLFLPWQIGSKALYEVEGAENSEIRFAVTADELAASKVALSYGGYRGAYLIDFSIFSLPVESQNAFKTLLLIPIGALVVVVLRNLVGLQTSGTFMPILIAMVFVQTELLTGLVLFVVVVSIGLVIRSYLTSLNLLLVPRIAAVLIVVISLYIFLSVIGFKIGLTEALSVTFFPMIIISWTIERMSVLAEEEGLKDVLLQGGGSLLTAVIAYLFMTNRHIEFWTFEFPELLLVVLAVILVIGQYTGYRLNELWRFEPLAKEK
jgi:hypothetical protein